MMDDDGKDLEGSGHGLIEVLPHHFPRGTEENHRILTHKVFFSQPNSFLAIIFD
jgi:hypothetical protein